MTIMEIVSLLRSSKAADRRAAWNLLWELRDKLALGQRDLADLEERARNEPDLELLSLAKACACGLREFQKPVLQDQLWAPFGGTRSRRALLDGEAAVVAICDEHAVPDAPPLINLARHLPEVEFPLINLAQPDWDQLELGRVRAICMVGRPSVYRDFVLTEYIPADLRLHIPRNDAQWRGKPPNQESTASYHRLEQWWAGRCTGAFEVRERSGPGRGVSTRIDYALVQRFPVWFGGRQIIVVLLAGATSLGTAGAVLWATRERFAMDQVQGAERYQQPITDETRIEVLLEVAGTLHTPRRPWTPRVRMIKLFLNGSMNLASGAPSSIRLLGGKGGADAVTAVLFDGDGVRADTEEYPALVALCLKAAQTPVVPLQELMTDSSVWPNRRRPAEWENTDQVRSYYVEKFQRRALKGRLHVHQKNALALDSAVELD